MFADDASVSTTIHLLRSVIISARFGCYTRHILSQLSPTSRSSGPRCSNTRAPRPPRCSHLGFGVLRSQTTKGSGTKWLPYCYYYYYYYYYDYYPSLRSALVELDVHRTSQLLSPARRVANAARCRRSVFAACSLDCAVRCYVLHVIKPRLVSQPAVLSLLGTTSQ